MLLTITNALPPATDLGYLLHKNPARAQSFPLAFGRAHVFYPEATNERCTVALLLDVDPVGLVRGGRGGGRPLEQYVNDRPYVASSFLSVAIARVFGSAMAGRSKGRDELAQTALPLRARLSVVPCRGGEEFLRKLFAPLGYAVQIERYALDENFPEWGASDYFAVELSAGRVRLRDLLTHLYVLIPVLDNEKHYWVGDEEVEKLLRRGEGWLASHPEREAITRRYLKYRRGLADEALARLSEEETPGGDREDVDVKQDEEVIERPLNLNERRQRAVLAVLQSAGARRVIDLGCGEGRLVKMLLEDNSFTEIVGLDVSHRTLQVAADRLRLDRMPTRIKERVRLLHGSLTYRDKRLAGFDAATVVEVIEHLDESRLSAFEKVLFAFARPRTVIVTTPNVEYNVNFAGLTADRLRHRDHRFEWTRAEFQNWAGGVAARHGYAVRFADVGDADPLTGAPTQMGVFTLAG